MPIVEPEILMNGNHTIARCEEVTNAALESVFAALFDHRVVLELMLLKTGMILSGAECPQQAEVAEVAGGDLALFPSHSARRGAGNRVSFRWAKLTKWRRNG